MTPHETKPDSTVESPEGPREPCRQWRGTLRFQSQLQMRTMATAAIAEESRVAPCDLHGHCTFLKPQEWVPKVPSILERNLNMLLHLMKNQEIVLSTRDEALSNVASQDKSRLPS